MTRIFVASPRTWLEAFRMPLYRTFVSTLHQLFVSGFAYVPAQPSTVRASDRPHAASLPAGRSSRCSASGRTQPCGGRRASLLLRVENRDGEQAAEPAAARRISRCRISRSRISRCRNAYVFTRLRICPVLENTHKLPREHVRRTYRNTQKDTKFIQKPYKSAINSIHF